MTVKQLIIYRPRQDLENSLQDMNNLLEAGWKLMHCVPRVESRLRHTGEYTYDCMGKHPKTQQHLTHGTDYLFLGSDMLDFPTPSAGVILRSKREQWGVDDE